jgi:hypothetical protein
LVCSVKNKLGLALKIIGRNINKIIFYLYSMFKQIKFNKIKKFVINKKQKKRNFSSETQSSNSNNIDYLDSQNLENLTLKELKKVAKEHHINLKGKTKKADIKQSIKTFFLTKNRSSDIKVISPKFPIVGDGIVCSFSSDSKSPNGGLDSSNETKFEEMSLKKLRITLENMSAVSLRKLAKDYGIELRGHRSKAERIPLIMDYFSKRKTASSEDNFEVLANEKVKQKGLMISNSFIDQREDNFINISALFRLDKKKI